jgi:hypothetical protein
MKNLNQIEMNQYINKCTEEIFINIFINKDLDNLSNIINSNGEFCTLNKFEFIEYLEKIFIELNYSINSYKKKYSTKLKVAEVVHSFKFTCFDSQHQEVETITMNLLLKIKNNLIESIYTENEFITEEEFEIRQFNN